MRCGARSRKFNEGNQIDKQARCDKFSLRHIFFLSLIAESSIISHSKWLARSGSHQRYFNYWMRRKLTINKHFPHDAIYSSIQTKENTGRLFCLFISSLALQLRSFFHRLLQQRQTQPNAFKDACFLSNKRIILWCSNENANAFESENTFWLEHYGGTSFALCCAVHFQCHCDGKTESQSEHDRERARDRKDHFVENLLLFQLQYNAH